MRTKIRNVALVLAGVAALALKGRSGGPWEAAARSYGGNVAASFAVYFIVANLPLRGRRCGPLFTAVLALAVVDLFEALDGFGVMTNVYDRADFAANAAGVALAIAVDLLASSYGRRRSHRDGPTA